MNPGYLSLLLLSITLILFASGWKELYVRSISHSGVLLFFIGWVVCSRFEVSIAHVSVNLVYAWVALMSLLFLWTTKGAVNKLHLLSIGLLLGSFCFLFQEILMLDPVMVSIKPELDAAVLLALLTVVLQRKANEQIACLSIGLLMGDFYYASVHPGTVSMKIGTASFQDQWWLSIFTARTLTMVVQSTYGGCKEAVKAWLERKGDWKK